MSEVQRAQWKAEMQEREAQWERIDKEAHTVEQSVEFVRRSHEAYRISKVAMKIARDIVSWDSKKEKQQYDSVMRFKDEAHEAWVVATENLGILQDSWLKAWEICERERKKKEAADERKRVGA